MSETVSGGERIGRNGVIIPDKNLCECKTSVDTLFLWMQRMVRENLEEAEKVGRGSGAGLVLIPGIPGTDKDHSIVVHLSYEGNAQTVTDSHGRGRAKVTPHEVYTVEMSDPKSAVTAPVMRVSRREVSQTGALNLHRLASNEPKVEVLSGQGEWVKVNGDDLEWLQPDNNSLGEESKAELSTQDALVRAAMDEFIDYIS